MNIEKKGLTIAFIGPSQSGKSTLIGRCLILTETVSPLELRRLRDEARDLHRSDSASLILDTTPEEKLAGRSLELARAHFELEECRILALDCPGDPLLFPCVLSAIAQADIIAIVITPQSIPDSYMRELLCLARMKGRPPLLVINKMDDVDWDGIAGMHAYKRMNELAKEYGFTEGFFGCSAVAAKSGYGIQTIHGERIIEFLPLFDLLNCVESKEINTNDSLRISVWGSCEIEGLCVSMVKVETGKLKSGELVNVCPENYQCRVSRIFSISETPISQIAAGDFGFVEANPAILSGKLLFDKEHVMLTRREFEADIEMLEGSKGVIFSAGLSCILHICSDTANAIITKVWKDGFQQNGLLEKGEFCFARVRAERNIFIENYAINKLFGTFILRINGSTIAIGRVLRIKRENTLSVS